MKRLGLLAAMLALTPLPCAAQRATPAFARWQIDEAQPIGFAVSGDAPVPNYGRIGLLTGAAIGAVAGGLGLNAVCHREGPGGESCFVPTLMGAALGAALLGLIGYGFGREIPRSSPASTSISGVAALTGAAP